jgi:hypothetical protein
MITLHLISLMSLDFPSSSSSSIAYILNDFVHAQVISFGVRIKSFEVFCGLLLSQAFNLMMENYISKKNVKIAKNKDVYNKNPFSRDIMRIAR